MSNDGAVFQHSMHVWQRIVCSEYMCCLFVCVCMTVRMYERIKIHIHTYTQRMLLFCILFWIELRSTTFCVLQPSTYVKRVLYEFDIFNAKLMFGSKPIWIFFPLCALSLYLYLSLTHLPTYYNSSMHTFFFFVLSLLLLMIFSRNHAIQTNQKIWIKRARACVFVFVYVYNEWKNGSEIGQKREGDITYIPY